MHARHSHPYGIHGSPNAQLERCITTRSRELTPGRDHLIQVHSYVAFLHIASSSRASRGHMIFALPHCSTYVCTCPSLSCTSSWLHFQLCSIPGTSVSFTLSCSFCCPFLCHVVNVHAHDGQSCQHTGSNFTTHDHHDLLPIPVYCNLSLYSKATRPVAHRPVTGLGHELPQPCQWLHCHAWLCCQNHEYGASRPHLFGGGGCMSLLPSHQVQALEQGRDDDATCFWQHLPSRLTATPPTSGNICPEGWVSTCPCLLLFISRIIARLSLPFVQYTLLPCNQISRISLRPACPHHAPGLTRSAV